MATPVRNPLAAGAVSGPDLIARLPKVWIGYLLSVATFVAEAIVLSDHPEIASGQFFVPPLYLFLLGFVTLVYWLVCIHQLHEVLAHVPLWKHPISPARAVWLHFIPIYSFYWLYKWPGAVASFVNWKLQSAALQPRRLSLIVLISYLGCLLLGPGGLVLLFFSLSQVTLWVRRAISSPNASPPSEEPSPQ